jgi:DNA processing protein
MSKTKIDQNSKYLLGFSLISEIGPARFKKIEESFDSIQEAWNCDSGKLERILGKKVAEKIYQKIQKINLDKEMELLKKEGIKVITSKFNFEDFSGTNIDYFPKMLSEISSSPFILFAKGNLNLLSEKQLSVVGSRRPSYYGKQVVEKIIPEICLADLVITSGMAMGIDSLSHRQALDNEKPTIAVLGSGLGERILKKAFNYRLGQEIIEKNGLLVSEYPPNFEANKFTFPARNRIISGLSLGVLVIEAAERSGTLITARYALEQNREIMAIPGNIFSQQSLGTNKLIKQGAEPVTSANDVFKVLNWKISSSQPLNEVQKISFDDKEEKMIYNKLSFDPQSLDKLVLMCKLDISTISVKLSMMEIKGLVKNTGGGYIKN